MNSGIQILLSLSVISGCLCYPTTGWTGDLCSRRQVIEVKSLEGHINSYEAKLNTSDDCQLWIIQAQPNKTITIRFSNFMSDAFTCNEGAYVEMGPAPKSTLCGVPKMPFTYHSLRDHVWIKFVIPKSIISYDSFFKADYISELGSNCAARCNDGTCIMRQWVCNGQAECLDSSDEMNCRINGRTTYPTSPPVQKFTRKSLTTTTSGPPITPRYKCGKDNLHCLTRYFVQACLPTNRLCNGVVDCLNGQDEENCKPMTSLTPTVPNPCIYGEIYCKIRGMNSIYRCLHNVHKCDGIADCYDNQDENPNLCEHEECSRRLEQPNGWLAPPFWSSQCSWVIHQQGSSPNSKIQLRTTLFNLDSGTVEAEYVKVYDGPDASYPLIGRYDGLNPPPELIESSSNWLHVMYHLIEGNTMAFNFTYQTKGACLPSQIKCSQENDCFERKQRCNGIWDCPISGSDELGCGRCSASDYYCGMETGQCYHKAERCNGITRCSSKVDEINCSPIQCGTHNGTFLCDNSHCIYESWVCDQRDDCGDNSDERNCGGSTKRVIIAAISGSMTCALLLVILMGCSCKLYSLRVVDHRRTPRHESPMSRLYAELLRRRAPPPYHEAMLTSRNFDEVQQEFLERNRHAANRTRRSRRSRSRNNQQNEGSQDGDTNNNGEQGENNQEIENVSSDTNVIDGDGDAVVTNTGDSNNVDRERTSSTEILLPPYSQTSSSSVSEDSDEADDNIRYNNRDAPIDENSDDENILTSQSLSARWARGTERGTQSDEECLLDDLSTESQSINETAEPLMFSSSFRDSHCDNASAGSLSVNSIELPEISPSSLNVLQENSPNENDSDYDKRDEDDDDVSSPKPETFLDRSVISNQRRMSSDSLNSEGSEVLSDNDVPMLPLSNSNR